MNRQIHVSGSTCAGEENKELVM